MGITKTTDIRASEIHANILMYVWIFDTSISLIYFWPPHIYISNAVCIYLYIMHTHTHQFTHAVIYVLTIIRLYILISNDFSLLVVYLLTNILIHFLFLVFSRFWRLSFFWHYSFEYSTLDIDNATWFASARDIKSYRQKNIQIYLLCYIVRILCVPLCTDSTLWS